MKIVTSQEMARVEKLAYAEGYSEEQFMNQAGRGVAKVTQRFLAEHHLKPHILLLCGAGNNAGDAFVAGRILLEGGFQVTALSCAHPEKRSPLCVLQSDRFLKAGGVIQQIEESSSISFGTAEILIDGLLGTGFHGEIHGVLKKMIAAANASRLPILAVDIPSGMNGTTGEIADPVIHAEETIFLGLPKMGCFVPEAWEHVGRIHIYNFGLHESFIAQSHEEARLIDDHLIVDLLPHIQRTRHKYQAGYVVGIGGSRGMTGAPTMACYAALRSGAGIVRHFHPEEMEASSWGQAPLEIIHTSYSEEEKEPFLKEQKRASALFIGPGMGISPKSRTFLLDLLPEINKPCVIDAEAQYVATEQPGILPPQSILTPHHGEMTKILRLQEMVSFPDLLQQSDAFAQQHQTTIILKGAPTYILHAGQKPFVCAHGDPGMATAGSGDILCGMVAAFLAQTKDPLKAALLGVQFHAMAGEYAAATWTSSCMIATDLLSHLPTVFKYYYGKRNSCVYSP